MNRREEYEKALARFENCMLENPITKGLIASAVKKLPANVHKSDCGKLSILAGSVGLSGAAVMASRSALRCGCGLITLLCPDVLNTVFEISLTEPMTFPLDSLNGAVCKKAKNKILEQTKNADAFLIGPGLSRSDDITMLVEELVQEASVPLIIDADGINALCENTHLLTKAKYPVILTPHIGEFARLVSKSCEDVISDREKLAKDFATKYNVILVLKSHETIVVLPDGKTYHNVLGNPGMAKGGSGDVLAGCIASFMAQTGDAVISALAGTYFHSLAADMAVSETGERSLTPTDTIEFLKYAIKETSEDYF